MRISETAFNLMFFLLLGMALAVIMAALFFAPS